MNNTLAFRRQFLLSEKPIIELSDWNQTLPNKYYLYSHPDINLEHVEHNNVTVVLIGDIYDYTKPESSNRDILFGLTRTWHDNTAVFNSVKKLFGCYTLIFINDQDQIIFSDARGTYEIYYTCNNSIVCGSQPNLIQHYSAKIIYPTKDPLLQCFFDTELHDSRWIGEDTCFQGVRHLLPNHYLNLVERKTYRYWPNQKLQTLSLQEAVQICSKYLEGAMDAVTNRSKCMMALTAGIDSRTLLAASRNIIERLYLFTNDHDIGLKHPDITIPEQIAKKYGLNYHIHIVSNKVDNNFRDHFYRNVFLANKRLLPSIYNVFYKNHQDKTVILGVGEIGRTFYGKTTRNLNSLLMAYKLGYIKSRYVQQQCELLINKYVYLYDLYNINPMTLLYWEQRLGNWGATRNSESNIAIKKIDPFNSHYLYETFQFVGEKYRFYGQGSCILFNEIIKNMWPELMNWPVNPPINFHESVSNILNKIGLFAASKSLKYYLHYFIIKRILKT